MTTPPAPFTLLPEQRRYLEHVARRLAPHVAHHQRKESLLLAEPADRDDTLTRLAAIAADLPPRPISFKVGTAAARALAQLPPAPAKSLAPVPPPFPFLGIPIRVDPNLPRDLIAVEHPDGRREYVKITPPRRRFEWRRFLGRCRSWRRAPRP